MSVVIDVAEAVKDELNDPDYDFGLPFEAVRVRQKRKLTLDVLQKGIHVEVVHVGWSSDLAARGATAFEPVIDIFIRTALVQAADQEQATGDIPTDELDRLEQLAETVAVHFQPEQTIRSGRLDSYEDAAWKETKVATRFENDTRIWQAHIRLTFDV